MYSSWKVLLQIGLVLAVTVNAKAADTKSTWTGEKCKTQAAQILKQGEACLPIKTYSERRACFFKIGPALPAGYFEGCQSDWVATMKTLTDKDKQMYPKDCSAVTDNGTCKQPAETAAPAKPAWTPEKCKAQAATIMKQGEACVPKAVYADRRACFWQLGPSLPTGYFDACQADWVATTNALAAKDKAAHPKDCSAVTDNGTCKQPTTTTTTMPKATIDCGKLIGDQRAKGQNCILNADAAKRKMCLDGVISTVEKTPGSEACSWGMKQMTDEFKMLEKARYPKAAPSLE